ncbi:HNH endonuclease [Alteromonas sp. 345S023]|uniref:HNH endonuclease n=1 Tax=Alteromonas profundi TaxID=2696062 RepID=A0A7X5LK72_9ALTE|nr:HNH endonuclease [Alteromonas profundi]NDV90499.1 HNH endonuclease [Alteromonas profundi]
MFVVGKEYNRRSEIHDVYGGQAQGGISTPKNHPFIFIFTSDSGAQHGYRDEYIDGLFWYTGEGQVGDMQMIKGNKAILNHSEERKTIHLFEYTRKAHVRYVGEAECLGYETQIRPDSNGNHRNAFVFQLDINSSINVEYTAPNGPALTVEERKKTKNKNTKRLDELRRAALAVPETKDRKEKQRNAYQRAEAIKKYVLARANGICEGCEKPAPFRTSKGPYLECHHLHRLADGGPDHPRNVIALCPNCHRAAHYSKNAKKINEEMVLKINGIEK